jgi:hypothetical protein
MSGNEVAILWAKLEAHRKALDISKAVFRDACDLAIASLGSSWTPQQAADKMRVLVAERVGEINRILAEVEE